MWGCQLKQGQRALIDDYTNNTLLSFSCVCIIHKKKYPNTDNNGLMRQKTMTHQPPVLVFILFSAQLSDGCLFAMLNSHDSPACLRNLL